MQYQLQQTGCVIHMSNTYLYPKWILYSQQKEGQRAPGRQKKHYKDIIVAILKNTPYHTEQTGSHCSGSELLEKSVQEVAE